MHRGGIVNRGCLVDARTLAAELGVPVSWIYTKAEAGHLPHLKLGRYVRFDRSEVEVWLASRRRGRLSAKGDWRKREQAVP